MKTSIIIPCYNEKHAIRETIECIWAVVRESEIKNVEIIAVNDGSTDGSEHVLNAFTSVIQCSMGLTCRPADWRLMEAGAPLVMLWID